MGSMVRSSQYEFPLNILHDIHEIGMIVENVDLAQQCVRLLI